MNIMSLPSVFGRYGEDIEAELKSMILGESLPLYRMMAYHMDWLDDQGETEGAAEADSGKRIRPTICLLTCEALGGERRMALPAAAALDLVHNFSLIHNAYGFLDLYDNGISSSHPELAQELSAITIVAIIF